MGVGLGVFEESSETLNNFVTTSMFETFCLLVDLARWNFQHFIKKDLNDAVLVGELFSEGSATIGEGDTGVRGSAR
jgi:hypothetical protein